MTNTKTDSEQCGFCDARESSKSAAFIANRLGADKVRVPRCEHCRKAHRTASEWFLVGESVGFVWMILWMIDYIGDPYLEPWEFKRTAYLVGAGVLALAFAPPYFVLRLNGTRSLMHIARDAASGRTR